MNENIRKLSLTETFFSRRFLALMTTHSAWLETGYNYLCSVRDQRKDQAKRRSEFVSALQESAAKAGIKPEDVNEAFANDVLDQIKGQFSLSIRCGKDV